MKSSVFALAALTAIAMSSAPNAAGAIPLTYTITTVDVPNAAGGTRITGINDTGQVVGTVDTSYVTYNPRGFIYNQGSGSVAPFGLYDEVLGQTTGINDSGQILTVGGKQLDGIGGNYYYSTLRDPNSGNYVGVGSGGGVFARGINNAGLIVGSINAALTSYSDHTIAYNFTDYGFLRDPATGTLTPLSALGFTTFTITDAYDINNFGQIVGDYSAGGGSRYQGFLRDPATGTYTTLSDPSGINGTFARALNDVGQVVGLYSDAAQISHSFILDLATQTYTTLNFIFPTNASFVSVNGINNAGQIAGTYYDGTIGHGFIATPSAQVASVPEPASLMLLASSIAAITLTARRRSRTHRTS